MKITIILLLLIFSSWTLAGESEDNRAGKKFETTLQLAPVDYRMGNTAVSGMYFLSPNELIGLRVSSVRGQESQDAVAVQFKRYLANSFYLAPEIFYLRSREDVNGFWGDFFNQRDYATHTSLGGSLRLGNQWTWKNFTLGCDWIGFGRRFGTFRRDTHKSQPTTVTFLNLIIGYSF